MINARFISEPIEKGQMYELLTGQAGNRIPNPYFDTPTDPTAIFEGIRDIMGDRPEVMAEFLNQVQHMAADPEYAYMAVYYAFDIQDNPGLFGEGFVAKKYILNLFELIRKNEAALRLNRSGSGAQDPEGWWGIASRTMESLKKAL
ncbi:MAG: hypothetical protein H6581_24375 [Bacteroidia bacterium]|nr:hypothetical protein [Bacteroidia bacterium]